MLVGVNSSQRNTTERRFCQEADLQLEAIPSVAVLHSYPIEDMPGYITYRMQTMSGKIMNASYTSARKPRTVPTGDWWHACIRPRRPRPDAEETP